MNKEIKQLASIKKGNLVTYRRYLHQHPELSFQEENSSRFIKEKLTAAGVGLMEGISGNSVVGVLEGNKPGKTIAFRADFDALALEEDNPDCEFRSQNPGVMHACGHDAHAAILLCLAETFAANREMIEGKVIFLFQQGEERQPGGAKILVEDGALKGVDFVIGLHVSPDSEVGTIASIVGPHCAGVDDFELTITGHGAHGSQPHLSADPILCGVSIINEFQQIVSRNVNPTQPLVITVGRFSAGHARNVIPETAHMLTTVRFYDEEVRAMAERRIKEIIDSVCKMKNCTYELTYDKGYPAVICPEKGVQLLRQLVDEQEYENVPAQMQMGSEDFSYYLRETDGCFFRIGSGYVGKSNAHNPNFKIDEACLPIGLEMMLGMYRKVTADLE